MFRTCGRPPPVIEPVSHLSTVSEVRHVVGKKRNWSGYLGLDKLGPLDENMAVRPYSSCPLLFLIASSTYISK
jgi:hypothetical protein